MNFPWTKTLAAVVVATAGLAQGGYAGDGGGWNGCGAECGIGACPCGVWALMSQFGHDTHAAVRCLIHCRPCYAMACGAYGEEGYAPGAAADAHPHDDLIEIVPRPWPPDYQEVAPPGGPEAFMRRQRQAHARRRTARKRAVAQHDATQGLPHDEQLDRAPRPNTSSVLAAFRPTSADNTSHDDDEPVEIMATASDHTETW